MKNIAKIKCFFVGFCKKERRGADFRQLLLKYANVQANQIRID